MAIQQAPQTFNQSTQLIDNLMTIRDNIDNTKAVQFEVSATPTGTTEIKTLKATSGTLPQENTVNTFTATQNINGTSGGTYNNVVSTATNTNTTATRADLRAYRVNLTGTANTNIMSNFLDGISFGTVTPATNNIFTGLQFGTTGSTTQGYDYFFKNADTTKNPNPFSTFYLKGSGELYVRNIVTPYQEAINATTSTSANGTEFIHIHSGVTAGNHTVNLQDHTTGGVGAGSNIAGTAFFGNTITIRNNRTGISNTATIVPFAGATITPIGGATQANYVMNPDEIIKIKYSFARSTWDIIERTYLNNIDVVVNNINLVTTGAKALWTNNTGKIAVLTDLILDVSSHTGVTTPATVQVGRTGTTSDIYTSRVLTGTNDTNIVYQFGGVGTTKTKVANTQVINLDVTVGSAGTTPVHTVNAYLSIKLI